MNKVRAQMLAAIRSWFDTSGKLRTFDKDLRPASDGYVRWLRRLVKLEGYPTKEHDR